MQDSGRASLPICACVLLSLSQATASAKGSAVRDAKDAVKDGSGDKTGVDAALAELMAAKAELAAAEEALSLRAELPVKEDGTVDCTEDFFGEAAYLAVSGQLNGEMYACALSDIYTFGPTFRYGTLLKDINQHLHHRRPIGGSVARRERRGLNPKP